MERALTSERGFRALAARYAFRSGRNWPFPAACRLLPQAGGASCANMPRIVRQLQIIATVYGSVRVGLVLETALHAGLLSLTPLTREPRPLGVGRQVRAAPLAHLLELPCHSPLCSGHSCPFSTSDVLPASRTVSGTLSPMLRAWPPSPPPPPPLLHVPAPTSPSLRGWVPSTSSNIVLSCQVRLCPMATFSSHGACHYLRLLWFVCPRPTYLVGSPGSRCSDGIGGGGGGGVGEKHLRKKRGGSRFGRGGGIRMWLEKSLCPAGAPERGRPTGASRVGRNSSALGPPPRSVIVQGLPREGHDFSLKAEEDLGDASGRRLPAWQHVPS